jgi:hypothetical protein
VRLAFRAQAVWSEMRQLIGECQCVLLRDLGHGNDEAVMVSGLGKLLTLAQNPDVARPRVRWVSLMKPVVEKSSCSLFACVCEISFTDGGWSLVVVSCLRRECSSRYPSQSKERGGLRTPPHPLRWGRR